MSKQNKELKYFCKKCQSTTGQSTKKSKWVIVYETPGDNSTAHEIEVIKDFETTVTSEGRTEKKSFKARQLECNHYVSYYTPGFVELNNSGDLNEIEFQIIREKLAKEMVGLQAKELEQKILFHCEQYQTLLKISTKQAKQARFAIIFLDELREKYVKQLTEDEKQSFEMKFAHFLDQRPTTNKTIERERKEVDKVADKQKIALEAARQLLMGKGINRDEMKKLFAKSKPETAKEASETTQTSGE